MAQLTLLLRRSKRNGETKVDLSNKELSYIPNDLYGLSKVEILDLSNNQINVLDGKIIQLQNLKVLDISNNQLQELPKQIIQLPNLKSVNVDGNPLVEKFKPLLQKTNDLNIQNTLKRCFGIEYTPQEKSTPSWLSNDGNHSFMNNSKAFGKMVEVQQQFKAEKAKVKQLQKQLDKLTLKDKKLSGQSFQIDVQPILDIIFQQLKIGEQISQGGFSTIHKGEYKGLKVAVKKIFNPKINDELLRQFTNQINMLAKMRHPNIVLLIGICSTPPNLCTVLEYVENGSIYDLIHRKKTQLKSDQRVKIVRQMVSAVHYLHEHKIVHRDIKSHNFLIDQNYIVKLCDFGLSKNENQLNKGPMQFSGTPTYMSQQLFQKKIYDRSVDIFALGTLLYEIYTGQIPYNGLDPVAIKSKIMKDCRLPNNHQLSKPLIELMNRCRSADPEARPSTLELMKFDSW